MLVQGAGRAGEGIGHALTVKGLKEMRSGRFIPAVFLAQSPK